MKALQNIKVLDLSKMLPGNYCSMLLADYGAQVIKVELPGREDPVRSFQPQKAGLSYWHIALNRNKKSLSLDYKSPEGKKVFFELVKTADVLLESFRPGQLEKWGLSYEVLKEINPRLIYCSISGYGKTQQVARATHDINVAGLTGSNYEEGKEPFVGPVQMSGLSGAMHAAFGILAAVNARTMTNQGQHVDVSLMRSSLSLLAIDFSNYLGFKETGSPIYPRRMPNYSTYKTKDGKYMTVGAFEAKFWQRLCEILDITELQDKIYDKTKREEIFSLLEKKFAEKTRTQWEEIFAGEDICVTGVYSFLEAAEKGCFVENEMMLELHDEKFGQYKQLAPPIFFSETPADASARATYPGENNKEILFSLGFDEEKIADMEKKGIF